MKRKLLMLFLSFFLAAVASAQEKTITGKVTSAEDGLPIPGVTIRVKGSSTATQTENNGNFAIKAKTGDLLEFVYLGMATVERTVGATNSINVSLASSNNDLNEIVVVGYGTQKKANLTGAVSTIDVKKTLEARPIADVGRALQGAAAGLSIQVPSGEVGSDPIIKIRGQLASFQGSNSPLILVDNVEIPSIQLVNPTDIASITILKDAAASSIYGAKAAFGVVLITTKKGSTSSKPQIDYTNNFSYQNPWKEIKMADVDGLRYVVDAAERIGISTPRGAFYKVDRNSYNKAVEWKEKYGNSIGANDPTVYGRDWYVQGNDKMGVRTYNPYDVMFREWAPTQTHNLSVGGTSGKTNYNVGLALLDQSGMIKPAKKDAFTRYNASLRLSSEVTKNLNVRAGALFSRRNKEYPYATSSTTADVWYYLYRWSSLYPLGNDENGDPIRSPASEFASANTANILQNYFNVNLGSTLTITNNWKVDFDYTFSNQGEAWKRPGTRFTARDSWTAPVARVDNNGNPVYVNGEGQVVAAGASGAMRAYDLLYQTYTAVGSNPDHIFRSVTDFYSHTINAFTTYNLNIDSDHDFKFIAGLNRVAATTEWQSALVTTLTNYKNPQFAFATGTPTIDGDKFWDAQLGYFGRVNYAFKNRYLVEGNIRYDGSSKFPKNLKWRWFPSFSAGWIASEESFAQFMKPVVNLLKVRGSWGSIGDQTVPNGLYIPIMDSGLISWINSGNNRVSWVGTPPAVQADIRWQDIVTKNIGLDMSLFNSKINLTAELFQRNTKNMIVAQEGIPLTFGVGAPQGNFGELATKGWELSIDFNHRFKSGLGINFRGNISDAKTTLISGASGTQVTGNYNGKTIGEIWGYRTDRLYQYDDFELDASGKPILITLTAAESALNGNKKAYKLKSVNGSKPVYQPFLQNSSTFYFGPGDVKFKDVNGDGEISNGNGTLANYGDLEVIGNTTPRYEYGFRLGADYKGFDFGAFFQGVGSRKIAGVGMLASPGFNVGDGAMPQAFAGDYWRPDNTGAFYPAAFDNGTSNNINNMQVQDRYLLNMAYLRLKNLTIGYTFKQNWLKTVKINSLRVYTALENIITWDHLGDLPLDPETITGYSMWNGSNYNSGRTGMGTPTFKSVSFGLQLSF